MVHSDLFALASGHLNIHVCYMFIHLVMLIDFTRNMHWKCIQIKLDEFFYVYFLNRCINVQCVIDCKLYAYFATESYRC